MTGSGNLEAVIASSILSRVAEGAGRQTLDAARGLVLSAPVVNELERVAKVLSLGDHLRSALCAPALGAAGDSTRAGQASIHSVFDRESAAVAAHNLSDYRAFIDDIPRDRRPGAMALREAVKDVLAETIVVFADCG